MDMALPAAEALLLVAVVEDELVLVDEVDGVLVERFSGEPLDLERAVLLGLAA